VRSIFFFLFFFFSFSFSFSYFFPHRYVYKTLIFSLIESKSDSKSLREFMMANMCQSMSTLRQIPVGILIEPLVKQCSITGYTEDDLQLLEITALHPRLSVKHALIMLDLVGKIVLNDPVYCRMCWTPMFSLLRRFPRQLQLQNFVLRFCKVALKQLLQNELRASGANDFDSEISASGSRSNRGIVQPMFTTADEGEEEEELDENSEHVLRRVFYEVDTNQSNSIEKRKLLQFMSRSRTPLHEACARFPRLSPLLQPKTYAQTLENMNTSQSGCVTFQEFKIFATRLSSSTAEGGSRSTRSNSQREEGGGGAGGFVSQPAAGDDFSSEYQAEMAAIQGKRVMIISVLGRLVSLRNADVNASILSVFQAARRNVVELYLNLPNLQDTEEMTSNVSDLQKTLQIRDDIVSALDQMIRICTATTPPTDVPREEVGTIRLAAADEERMWQKASIDDLDGAVKNVARGAHSILDQALPDVADELESTSGGMNNAKKEIILGRKTYML
jgi:Ca2+-binding EF-hand superfamily protein